MRAFVATLCALALVALLSAPAWAAFDEDDLKEIEQNLKKGNQLFESDTPLSGERWQIVVLVQAEIVYIVDFRTHLCFARWNTSGNQGTAPSQISCRAIKSGFPAFGRLITWEKDGWADQ